MPVHDEKTYHFVIGHSELDTMVNDYGGGKVVVPSGHHFRR